MKPSKVNLFLTKLTHWEYWPFEIVYFPIAIYYLWLSLKARSFFFFSASNPSIETGGMLGESKFSILKNIPQEVSTLTLFFPAGTSFEEVEKYLRQTNLTYPLISKPDVGERGIKVEKIENAQQLKKYLEDCRQDFLIQEYVDFEIELGVFYFRLPGQSRGVVSSIVKKDFLQVTGDGVSSLGALIAAYPRAAFQFERLRTSLDYRSIPSKGEKVILEPIGNHCRGTTFLSAQELIDEELTEVFDRISQQIPDFYFGRYDLRCKSIEELKAGKNIKILELNGAGAEPGHIYQPGCSIFKAWKELLFHWKILYQISTRNHKNGVPYMRFQEARERYKKIRALRVL
ncbi:MAG TPA: hypothetical protein VNB90_01210 [Cytophagaceae bacterium]|nr:hypothetical protein [Cytophagaceae bacterium]